MNEVKKACESLKLSQNELAEILGVHYTTFSKWKSEIPKHFKLAIDLMIENKALKAKLELIKQAKELINSL